MSFAIGLTEIEAAATRLAGHARRTPLLTSPFLDELAGRPVFVKAECLQHTGSFKFRGAWSALSALPTDQRGKGVLAYSSGNHAQGVAHAAALHGAPATIVMPSDAPPIKIDNTRRLGAEVVLYDRETESREEIGARLSAEQGLTLIRPYDEPMVLAGQGTTGLEIAEEAQAHGIREADVLVCCGGGGLTSGIALALAAKAPGLTVRPVEPEGFDDVTRSLASGTRQENDRRSGSLCDAILTPAPGELTLPIMAAHCGPGLVVSDADCIFAVAAAFARLRIVVEPGGAAALAAALRAYDGPPERPVICVATGGNVAPDIFQHALSQHPEV